MKLKPLLSGVASFIPLANRLRLKGTGGTDSARYCYSVWLRHLVMAGQNGLNTHPKLVAELGPGDSLGIGLAALLSGSERYYAFDVVDYTDPRDNIAVLDQLIELFSNRAPIPGSDEFPNAKPCLSDYSFPSEILDEQRLENALRPSRVQEIRTWLTHTLSEDGPLRYVVPWHDAALLRRESVDMIYSQAVLEHVDDLRNAYRAMHRWLKSDGYMSHQIDFKCHGTADEWNGHWSHSRLMWRLIRGRRPYLLNREPHSTHTRILQEEAFRILCNVRFESESRLPRSALAREFAHLSAEDITTSGAFIQAAKAT